MNLRVESLRADHECAGFASGRPQLDEWLIDHAFGARAQGTRTYVLVEAGDVAVRGYFAIAPHLIQRDEVGVPFARGMPSRIPAILLAKLALHTDLQGSGVGSDLLVFALGTIVEAARNAGGKLVVVDAIDEAAASFYRAHDFQPSRSDEHRLVLKLSTAAAALDLDWP